MSTSPLHKHIGKGAETAPYDVVHRCLAGSRGHFLCGQQPYDFWWIYKRNKHEEECPETRRKEVRYTWDKVSIDDCPQITQQHFQMVVKHYQDWYSTGDTE